MGLATRDDHRIIDAVSVSLGGRVGRNDDAERLRAAVVLAAGEVEKSRPPEEVLAEIAVAFIRWAQDLKEERDSAVWRADHRY